MRRFLISRFCKWLSILALCCVPFGAVQAEKRIALVIGNGSYEQQPLSNPTNDATLMAKTLRSVGFDVIDEIDADARAMKRAIHSFGRALRDAGSDAVGFVFYAGHGIQAKGGNYMIPVDARIEDALDVEFEGFPTSTLLSALDAAGNRLNIVVMDACRNNPYKAATRAGGGGLARMDAPSGTLIAYSTAPGKVAVDGRGKNSPYTRALARSMNTAGATVEQVFKSVRVSVMDRTNGDQVPWESSSLTGDFYFVEKAPEPVAVPEPAIEPQAVELTFWNSIKDGQTKALFESYLTQYPEGVFAGLAKAKIESISKKNAADGKKSDTAFFQTIQNSDDAADFQAYLKQFPDGTFASLAKARIAVIEKADEERAVNTASPAEPEIDADDAFWANVKDAQSVAEFEAYLKSFPNGKYVALARAKISGIEERRKIAALSPAATHPADGKWKISWISKGGTRPHISFCSSNQEASAVVVVRDGKFKTKLVSNTNSVGVVKGSFSNMASVTLGFFGQTWGNKHFRRAKISLDGGTGQTTFRGQNCGPFIFTAERVEQ